MHVEQIMHMQIESGMITSLLYIGAKFNLIVVGSWTTNVVIHSCCSLAKQIEINEHSDTIISLDYVFLSENKFLLMSASCNGTIALHEIEYVDRAAEDRLRNTGPPSQMNKNYHEVKSVELVDVLKVGSLVSAQLLGEGMVTVLEKNGKFKCYEVRDGVKKAGGDVKVEDAESDTEDAPKVSVPIFVVEDEELNSESNNQETKINESNIQKSNTLKSNTQKSNIQKSNTQEPNDQKPNNQESNDQKSYNEKPNSESNNQKPNSKSNNQNPRRFITIKPESKLPIISVVKYVSKNTQSPNHKNTIYVSTQNGYIYQFNDFKLIEIFNNPNQPTNSELLTIKKKTRVTNGTSVKLFPSAPASSQFSFVDPSNSNVLCEFRDFSGNGDIFPIRRAFVGHHEQIVGVASTSSNIVSLDRSGDLLVWFCGHS